MNMNPKSYHGHIERKDNGKYRLSVTSSFYMDGDYHESIEPLFANNLGTLDEALGVLLSQYPGMNYSSGIEGKFWHYNQFGV